MMGSARKKDRSRTMREGWHNDDYLVLFDEAEISAATNRYAISESLPGYEVVGLCGWDDFVVRDSAGQTYTIPSVAPEERHLSRFLPPNDQTALQGDDRFVGKIKWYVKPILFGGSPDLAENVTWVNHEQHSQLVRWWNQKYRELKAQKSI
jgi:hypothetical protein